MGESTGDFDRKAWKSRGKGERNLGNQALSRRVPRKKKRARRRNSNSSWGGLGRTGPPVTE